MTALDNFWAVIPAGGAGTRLWPLSRSAEPKFLHDLAGTGRSLLQATVDRLEPLVADRVLVVTGTEHVDPVRAQLPALGPGDVLAEPSPRDSMAAVGLAAAVLERRDPDAVMGSFAADHVITEDAVFADRVRTAVAAARQDWLVTVGIEPTHPATGFGYIHQGEELPGCPGAHRVVEFVEKPSPDVAESYVASGRYRWNAGMFLARPSVLLDLLAESDPGFAATLRELAVHPGEIGEAWQELPRIAIDHAVAEPAAAAGRVAVVPGAFGWDDIGDFASLAGLVGRGTGDDQGVTVVGDPERVTAVDAGGLVIPGSGREVAVVGLSDVAVVDTGDAVLVTSLERAQQVKDVVAALQQGGRGHLT